MPNADDPGRRSYSLLNLYEECGHKYLKTWAEDPGSSDRDNTTWWLHAGTAVHEAIEYYESWLACEPFILTRAAFDAGIRLAGDRFQVILAEMAAKAGARVDDWQAAKKGEEDGPWWFANGPKMVRQYAETRRNRYDWRLIGSEVKYTMDIVGVPFGGSIDQLWYSFAADGFAIDDIKSGATCPTSIEQLAWYAYAIEANGVQFTLNDQPLELDQYTREVLQVGYHHVRPGARGRYWSAREWVAEWPDMTQRLISMDEAVEAGSFPVRSGWLCRFCPAWDGCWGIGGMGGVTSLDERQGL